MHFWINKPVGRNYGFGSRRFPTSTFPKNRIGQRRIIRSSRSMIPPVHRFQNNDSNNAAGPSFQTTNRPPRSALRSSNERRNCSSRASLPLIQPDNITNNVPSAGNNHQILSAATNTTNRRILDFSEFSNAELAGYRLRCSLWIIFVLMTGFVAAAKFYFEYKGAGLEVLVICGLLVTLLLSSCFYAILYLFLRRMRNQLQETHAQSSSNNTAAAENARQISIVRQNPPPPYHIAILIPPINSLEDIPPPSYDKIMQ